MKNILLFLLALIVVAPAWAGDAATEPSIPQPSAQAVQVKPDAQTSCGSSFLIKEACAKDLPASPSSSCPTGCVLMNCPPPGGSVRCCHTSNYTPC